MRPRLIADELGPHRRRGFWGARRRPIFASPEASEYSDRLLDSHEMLAPHQDVAPMCARRYAEGIRERLKTEEQVIQRRSRAGEDEHSTRPPRRRSRFGFRRGDGRTCRRPGGRRLVAVAQPRALVR